MVADIFYGSITAPVPGFPQKQKAIRQSCRHINKYYPIFSSTSSSSIYTKSSIVSRESLGSTDNVDNISQVLITSLAYIELKGDIWLHMFREWFYTESECSYWGHIQCHYRGKEQLIKIEKAINHFLLQKFWNRTK